MSNKEQAKVKAENARLRKALSAARQLIAQLREANANLRVERDAADVLLGAAMDEVLARQKP
jgi:hypothetical protein